MLEKLTSAQTRQWFYTVVTAALAVLVFYGVLTPDSVPLWLGLAAALFAISGTGTAALKVHQQRKDGTLE